MGTSKNLEFSNFQISCFSGNRRSASSDFSESNYIERPIIFLVVHVFTFFGKCKKNHLIIFDDFQKFNLGKKVYKKKILNSMLRTCNILHDIKNLCKFKNSPKENSAKFNKIWDFFAFGNSLKKYMLFEFLTQNMEILEVEPAIIIILETRNFATHSDFPFEIKNEQYAWTTRIWTSTWYFVSYSKSDMLNMTFQNVVIFRRNCITKKRYFSQFVHISSPVILSCGVNMLTFY